MAPPRPAAPCRARGRRRSRAAERARVVELIAAGRSGRHSVSLPHELWTRDWDSVTTVMLELADRLGWEPAGWKIGAASEEVRRAEGMPDASPGPDLPVGGAHGPREPAARAVHQLPQRRVRARVPPAGCAARPQRAVRRGRGRRRHRVRPARRSRSATRSSRTGTARAATSASASTTAAAPRSSAVRPVADWRSLDLPDLRIEISLEGQVINEGYGRAAMGHPLTSLTWLANWLSARGRGLEAGEIVSTGTCTGHCFCARGDVVSVDFGRARRRRPRASSDGPTRRAYSRTRY